MSNRVGESAGKAGRPFCIFNRLRRCLLILHFGRLNAYYLLITIFERRKPTPLEQRELKESNTHEISTGYGPRSELNPARRSVRAGRGQGGEGYRSRYRHSNQ